MQTLFWDKGSIIYRIQSCAVRQSVHHRHWTDCWLHKCSFHLTPGWAAQYSGRGVSYTGRWRRDTSGSRVPLISPNLEVFVWESTGTPGLGRSLCTILWRVRTSRSQRMCSHSPVSRRSVDHFSPFQGRRAVLFSPSPLKVYNIH